MRIFLASLLILSLAACDNTVPPSVKRHPDRQIVRIDDYQVYVVKQAGNEWVASGGGNIKKDDMVEYRRQRGIEVQSKCRVNKVLSKAGEPLLRASVYQCRA